MHYDSSLPVTQIVAKNWPIDRNLDFIILQHILPDTRRFIQLLEDAGFGVPVVVAKPNSIDRDTMKLLLDDGMTVEEHSYGTLDNTPKLSLLVEAAAAAARKRGRRLAAIDVGGYFRRAMATLSDAAKETMIGTVEVTTYGHNKYRENLHRLQAPLISLARSPLKTAEAQIVGDAAVTAADMIMRRQGVLIQGRRAGVIGFGSIGESMADALRGRGLSTMIYDIDPKKLLRASLRGYEVTTNKHHLLREMDIVFSSTGNRAVEYHDLMFAKDGLTLVSAGSRANEFDISGLKANAASCRQVGDAIQEYRTNWGRRVRTLCDGKAVNFHIQSCPEEVMDVVFAEQLACSLFLAQAPRQVGVMHELPDDVHREIAGFWLQTYDRDSGVAPAAKVGEDHKVVEERETAEETQHLVVDKFGTPMLLQREAQARLNASSIP